MAASDPADDALRSPWRRALLGMRGSGYTPAWLINGYLNTVARLSVVNYWYWKHWRESTADADRLHLGSGPVYLEGWTNAEALLFWRRDLWLDLRYGLPMEDGAIRAIYANQVLEHFSLAQGKRLLKECHRVLRPGGVIRIAVPSFSLAATAYAQKDETFFRPFVPEETHGNVTAMANAFLLCDGHHQVLYDFELMRESFAAAGTWDWIGEPERQTSAVLEDKERQLAEGHYGEIQESCLVVEARKAQR